MTIPKRGDIFLVDLDPSLGKEQQGKRPVLIISDQDFNKITQVPIILPITSGGDFARVAGFAVSLSGLNMKTTGVVRCDQPRALDLSIRNAHKVESIPNIVLEDILARVQAIFE